MGLKLSVKILRRLRPCNRFAKPSRIEVMVGVRNMADVPSSPNFRLCTRAAAGGLANESPIMGFGVVMTAQPFKIFVRLTPKPFVCAVMKIISGLATISATWWTGFGVSCLAL